MHCMKCGQTVDPGAAFCRQCGSRIAQEYVAQPSYQPVTQTTRPQRRKSPLPIILGLLLAAALVTAGVLLIPRLLNGGIGDEEEQASNDADKTPKASGVPGGFSGDGKLEIDLGKPEEAATGQVGPSGGEIQVDSKKSDLNGLTLTIPQGAYGDEISFTISELPVQTDFGKDFTPLAPLIRIENGGGMADGFIELFVPCNVPEDAEPTAWYVDEATGAVEAIPVIDATDEGVTLSVRHFSDILVGAVNTRSLRNAGVIDTGFTPGADDWKFTNRGSAYAPGGHCAGQSMTAMWYYMYRKDKGSLYKNYDNYGWKDYGFATPTIWQDDVMGYRLATTAQVNCDWSDAKYNDFLESCRRSAKGTWQAFVTIMKMTGRPQFVAIMRKKPDGKYGGHALIAYKIDTEAGRIYVADPNYPGATNRYIEYDEATGFKPYSAAPDRDAADAGDYYSYTEILYVGMSSFMDLDKLNGYFKDFDGRTVGSGTWQSMDLKLFTKVPDENGNDQDVEITDGYHTGPQLKITSFSTPFNNSQIELFLHNSKGDQSLGDYTAGMTLNLEPGENYIGIYHKSVINSKPKFYDFRWIKVLCDFDFAGRWKGEMTWSEINMPSLADIIAAIPSDLGEDAYQSEVESETEDYNRVMHDLGKTYQATMEITLSDGLYEAEVVESHDLDGELNSDFAFKLVDGKLLMDETDGSDTLYFTFEQDKTAPPGSDIIVGKLKAHLDETYYSADVVIDFRFERVKPGDEDE